MTERRPAGRYALGLLTAAQALTGIGAWATVLSAHTFATYELHQNAVVTAALVAAWGGPPILLSLVAGRAIDRWGPKRIGVTAALASAAITGGGAVLLHDATLLLILVLLQGIGRAFLQMGTDVMPSWLRDRPAAATSSVWFGMAGSAPLIIGPMLGTTLTAVWGPQLAFATYAGFCLITATVLGRLSIRRPASTVAADGRLANPRFVRPLLACVLITAASYAALEALEPLYFRDVLSAPMQLLATNRAIFGISALAVTLVLGRRAWLLDRPFVVWTGMLAVACAEALMLGTAVLPVAMVASALFGASVAIYSPAARTALLNATPTDQHGRVLGHWRSLQSLGAMLPLLGMGSLAGIVGVRATMLGVAAIVATGALTARGLIRSAGDRAAGELAPRIPNSVT